MKISGGEIMEYTVHKLAKLAGVSGRTLRYYDEIGILKPARINPSGYRIYGKKEIDQLQQILFYKELGIDLKSIRKIMYSPTFDALQALKNHREELLGKRDRLNQLISNVEKTIDSKEGNDWMEDKEKFKGFKKELIEKNEKKYGKEVREKYGNSAVDQSNERLSNMTEKEYKDAMKLGEEVLETLYKAFQTKNPAGDLAQKTAELHGKWLKFYWGYYSKEAHAGIVRMYMEDERFKAFYDKKQPGATKFLQEAVLIYTGM